eukprot:6270460-Prymnesium_polylepis.1
MGLNCRVVWKVRAKNRCAAALARRKQTGWAPRAGCSCATRSFAWCSAPRRPSTSPSPKQSRSPATVLPGPGGKTTT